MLQFPGFLFLLAHFKKLFSEFFFGTLPSRRYLFQTRLKFRLSRLLIQLEGKLDPVCVLKMPIPPPPPPPPPLLPPPSFIPPDIRITTVKYKSRLPASSCLQHQSTNSKESPKNLARWKNLLAGVLLCHLHSSEFITELRHHLVAATRIGSFYNELSWLFKLAPIIQTRILNRIWIFPYRLYWGTTCWPI